MPALDDYCNIWAEFWGVESERDKVLKSIDDLKFKGFNNEYKDQKKKFKWQKSFVSKFEQYQVKGNNKDSELLLLQLKDLDYPDEKGLETLKKMTKNVYKRVYKKKLGFLKIKTAKKNLEKWVKAFDYDDFKGRYDDKEDYPSGICDKLNDFTYEKKDDSALNFVNYCEKFLKNRAVPSENSFKDAFKTTVNEIIKIYFKHLKKVKTLEFNKVTLEAFVENLAWANFKKRYSSDKDNYSGKVSKEMKESISNDKSFKDIKNAIQNVLKNTKYQEDEKTFKEKIHKPLKEFLKNYSAVLLKLLQFGRAKPSIDYFLKDIRVKQFKAYDSLEFKVNFSDDIKWFLKGVEGEEQDEISKLVKKNLPKQKPATKSPADSLKKKLREKMEKFFKAANKEETRDFQRDIIENFVKNVKFEKFTDIFDSKAEFKDKFVEAMKTMTLNSIFGKFIFLIT